MTVIYLKRDFGVFMYAIGRMYLSLAEDTAYLDQYRNEIGADKWKTIKSFPCHMDAMLSKTGLVCQWVD